MLTLTNQFNIHFPQEVLIIAGFLLAFLLTYIAIPTIVLISENKNLLDFPDERKSHSKATPVLGGLAIFAAFTLTAIIFVLPSDSQTVMYILGGLITLMIIGLKDDILVINPRKKILGQFIAAFIIVMLGNIRITDFHNVLGIGQVPYLVSVVFSVLLLALFIVSLNFIDGVDGLAAGFAIIASLFYGVWFYLTGNVTSSILSFSLAASLLAFLRFNIFGGKNKIFLGDAGVMITGLLIGIFTIQFLESELTASPVYKFKSAPFISIGLFFIPVFDTIRVIILRIGDGYLFKSGKNHIHHVILDTGKTHLGTSLILLLSNTIIFLAVIFLQPFGSTFLVFFIGILSVLLFFIIRFLNGKNGENNSK